MEWRGGVFPFGKDATGSVPLVGKPEATGASARLGIVSIGDKSPLHSSFDY
jgi:hypothetical protein